MVGTGQSVVAPPASGRTCSLPSPVVYASCLPLGSSATEVGDAAGHCASAVVVSCTIDVGVSGFAGVVTTGGSGAVGFFTALTTMKLITPIAPVAAIANTSMFERAAGAGGGGGSRGT